MGRAVMPTSNSMVRIFYFSHLLTQQGGLCPSSLRFCCFDVTRRVIYPSSSCHSSFDMAGRGMPPPCCVFVLFSTCWGGVCPSSLCRSCKGNPLCFRLPPAFRFCSCSCHLISLPQHLRSHDIVRHPVPTRFPSDLPSAYDTLT